MSPPLLEGKKIWKFFTRESAQVEVLRGIDLRVETGDQVAILGSSGAGKSTLLHVLSGLDRPTSGSVFYEGKNLFDQDEADLARFRNQTLGFVFQFHHLLPLFNTLENVMMPCRIANLSFKESEQRALALLDEIQLSHRLSHRPHELSGGEQQRVALARALVLDPKIVMADEPTGNLDSETSKKVFDLFMRLNEKRKTTLLVVTHNEELAGQLKRRVRLKDGRVFQEE